MLKSIQFHCQLGVGAVKIQDVFSQNMLPAEFETSKSSPAERPPKLLFVIRLIVTKMTGDLFEAHFGMMMILRINSSPSP